MNLINRQIKYAHTLLNKTNINLHKGKMQYNG